MFGKDVPACPCLPLNNVRVRHDEPRTIRGRKLHRPVQEHLDSDKPHVLHKVVGRVGLVDSSVDHRVLVGSVSGQARPR
jgi:hypothetical protein